MIFFSLWIIHKQRLVPVTLLCATGIEKFMWGSIWLYDVHKLYISITQYVQVFKRNWNHCRNVAGLYISSFELGTCCYHLFALEDQSLCCARLTWIGFLTLSRCLKHFKHQSEEKEEKKMRRLNIQVRHSALALYCDAQDPHSSRFLKILVTLLIIAAGHF